MAKLKLKFNPIDGSLLTKEEMRRIFGGIGSGSDIFGSDEFGSSFHNSGSGYSINCCYGENATHNICAVTPRTAEIFAGKDGYWTCNTDTAVAKCSSRLDICKFKYL